jgi:hypothetical protein
MRRRAAILAVCLVLVFSLAGWSVVATEAKERALSAEESYLSAQLEDQDCLESWGTNPSTAVKTAALTGLSTDGVVLKLSHSYWYSTDSVHADLRSSARYLVNTTDETRLSGDEIDPC